MNDKETLEEVAKSHAIYEIENNYKPTKESFKLACKRNFIRGAKWQAEKTTIATDDAYSEGFENGKKHSSERMYSEEEVGEILYNAFGEYGKHYGIMLDGALINKLFEQFKKK